MEDPKVLEDRVRQLEPCPPPLAVEELDLKENVLDRHVWATRDDLRIEIITWIERTYHRRRHQARLGRLTPIEYETIMTPQTAPAA